jgi:catechol 2,3-dioxygenase-like lactoylglutathione lyase family enzyme
VQCACPGAAGDWRHSYVCADQEETRHFYEDIIGLPLRATWVERAQLEGFPARFETFCHTFYGLEDGSALSFFQFANPEVAREFKAHRQTPFVHVALSVSTAAQEQIKKRLIDAHALAFEVDHGIFRSIYAHDPNGLLVEFACDPPNVAELNAMQNATARETLRRWQAGDRTINNDIRPGKRL